MPKDLRRLQERVKKAKIALNLAMNLQYPIGSDVVWLLGTYKQWGVVIGHHSYLDRLFVINDNTQAKYWIELYVIQLGENLLP